MKYFRTSRNCRFTLILGGFLARTPQKQSTFLTSDDKQDDASDMLQFFEVFRNGLNWAKKLIFWIILHPMKHTPRFCQMKNFIKIYICGKFHQYSICGCEMKDFQGFLYWFNIHKMVPFCDFLALSPPNQILFDLAETLIISSLQ